MTYAFDLHFQLRNGGERTLADDGGGGGHARCTAGRVFRVATICVRGSVLQPNAHVALCVIDEWTDRQRKERQQALKLLRRVELIVAEVSVRLTHLANQAEDAVANEDREDEVTAEVAEPETSSSLNSYYHFDSQGNKLKTKWDSYDVDAELERLEQEEQNQSDSATATVSASASAPAAKVALKKYAPADKKKLLTTAGGIEREFEAVLEFLDDIRGDGQVKQLRKAIALKINKEHFARIDHIRQVLAEPER